MFCEFNCEDRIFFENPTINLMSRDTIYKEKRFRQLVKPNFFLHIEQNAL